MKVHRSMRHEARISLDGGQVSLDGAAEGEPACRAGGDCHRPPPVRSPEQLPIPFERHLDEAASHDGHAPVLRDPAEQRPRVPVVDTGGRAEQLDGLQFRLVIESIARWDEDRIAQRQSQRMLAHAGDERHHIGRLIPRCARRLTGLLAPLEVAHETLERARRSCSTISRRPWRGGEHTDVLPLSFGHEHLDGVWQQRSVPPRANGGAVRMTLTPDSPRWEPSPPSMP